MRGGTAVVRQLLFSRFAKMCVEIPCSDHESLGGFRTPGRAPECVRQPIEYHQFGFNPCAPQRTIEIRCSK